MGVGSRSRWRARGQGDARTTISLELPEIQGSRLAGGYRAGFPRAFRQRINILVFPGPVWRALVWRPTPIEAWGPSWEPNTS